jgi:hypothetical protein
MGYDIILNAPGDVPVGEVVLKSCQRHWPRCVFLDDREDAVRTLDDPRVWRIGTASDEFFVYEDSDAADSWQRQGLTTDNAGQRLYVIVSPHDTSARTVEVTLVSAQLTTSVQRIVDDLRHEFGSPRTMPVLPLDLKPTEISDHANR